MAFFPFEMADPMDMMQDCFRQTNRCMRPFVAMGMPMMAQAQAQARSYRSRQPAPGQRSGTFSASTEDNVFHVELDVQNFAPEEISVKTVDNHVVIEGKHDERGSVSRHFVHSYSIPDGVKAEDITSSLSSDGVLTITAPRTQPRQEKSERSVPITPTGLPAKKKPSDDSSTSKSDGESKE